MELNPLRKVSMKIRNLPSLRTLAKACIATILLAAATSHATVASIQIFNTGVNGSGALLANNVADPHYSLIAAPAPYTTAMTGDGANDFAWLPDGPNSRWIGVTPWLAEWVPIGTYVYRTTFDLTGFNPSTATVNLDLASDNECRVFLNGVDTGILTGAESFTSFCSLSITNGFVNGLNTLDFELNNATTPGAPTHNPSGLRVELSGYATAIPEPTALAFAGLATLFVALERRKAK
jgi:hypothetical protein